MYPTGNIFPVLPIKSLVNQDSETNMTHKMATDTKLSVSNLHVLFRPYGVQKETTHVDTKALIMHHQ